jgi:hypothetical protein
LSSAVSTLTGIDDDLTELHAVKRPALQAT